MKRNSLKTVLHAFVFTLAIVASFAFTSASNDDPDDVYIQRLPPEYCDLLTVELPEGCSIYNWGSDCTINISPVTYDIYSRAWGNLCMDKYRYPL